MKIRLEEVPVPVERLNGAVERSMQKVRTEYREKTKSYLIKMAAVAAILILTAGIFATNPVLAAKLPLIGHIFEMVQEGQRYSGNFDKMAQLITENTPNVSGGVTISLSEIYSNQEAMYAAAVIKTEKSFPEEVKESNMPGDDDIGYRMYLSVAEQEFDTNVAVDTGEAAEIAVNESAPNGEVISCVTMTPYEARINYDVDESKVQPGYEKRDSLQSVIVDSDGKRLQIRRGCFLYPVINCRKLRRTTSQCNQTRSTGRFRMM